MTGAPQRVTADAAPVRGALERELAAQLGAAHEARFVVDEALDRTRGPGRRTAAGPLDEAAVVAARAMAARRAAGEPLQYVFGHWPFRSLDLLVDPRVLIPRPETEQVVEVALAEARRLAGPAAAGPLVAVDAGTGSGAIALSLATELGPAVLAQVWAVDASADALAVARANLAATRRVAAACAPVVLMEGSWLDPLPVHLRGAVSLVVSNPPYVGASEWAHLDAEVRREPRQALVAGPASDGTEGLADVEAVLSQARRWLGPRGVVVVELAPAHAGPAVGLARDLGYDDVRVDPDLAGRPRALVARTPG